MPRCRGGAEDPHPAGGVFDGREDVAVGAGGRHGLEEVQGDDRFGLGAQERRPGRGGALRRWVESGVCEDLSDGRGGDRDAEDEEFAVDSAVAP